MATRHMKQLRWNRTEVLTKLDSKKPLWFLLCRHEDIHKRHGRQVVRDIETYFSIFFIHLYSAFCKHVSVVASASEARLELSLSQPQQE